MNGLDVSAGDAFLYCHDDGIIVTFVLSVAGNRVVVHERGSHTERIRRHEIVSWIMEASQLIVHVRADGTSREYHPQLDDEGDVAF